ncbi:hypothetical protein M8C21_003531 [Ambrosia artemisiifolia]|uniref:non-specific serine/threonine protein kinase n=1 Tax=Ambrosia artemisiifolia TaxID=4212 RepID=A0AAD5CHR6_AMBAR|nr:hypothetical protein M8C21_003531 [Ambrosia artemisiifolia]
MSSKDSGSSGNKGKSLYAKNDKRNDNGLIIPPLQKIFPFLNNKLLGSSEQTIIVGAVAGATLLLFLVVTCIYCCCCCCYRCCKRKKKLKNKKVLNQQQESNDIHLKMPPTTPSGSTSFDSGSFGPHRTPLPPPHPGLAMGFSKNIFTYGELATATRGFDRSLLLGMGGFGYVFKGVLPNGKEVAVKSLKANSGQGDREFQAEVDIINRVHHRHLVSLVGYCMEGEKRILVYEFVPNRTLEYHLQRKNHPVLDFSTRLKIAVGAAKGFTYLHEDCCPRVIHRDIKAANILIDNQYVAPEYASTGKLTEKSDVFSFGVVLLELITGRRAMEIDTSDESVIDWAAPTLIQASDGGSFDEMVDPRLEGNYNRDEMRRMVACAAACLRHSAKKRPKMSTIVRVLEGDVLFNDISKADTKENVTRCSSDDMSDNDMNSYNGSNTSSQEFSSGEYGMASSESLDISRKN